MQNLRRVGVAIAATALISSVHGRLNADPSSPVIKVLPSPVAVPPPPAPRGAARAAVPQGNPALWVSTSDYPATAFRNHEEGTTTFRLKINPQGRVSECWIVTTSGSPALDAATCELITRRAIFRPALDQNGKQVAANYTNRVRWILPSGPTTLKEIKPEVTEVSFVIETDGLATDCIRTVNGTRIVEQSSADPCSIGMHFAPFANAEGAAVRKRVTYTTAIKVSDLPN